MLVSLFKLLVGGLERKKNNQSVGTSHNTEQISICDHGITQLHSAQRKARSRGGRTAIVVDRRSPQRMLGMRQLSNCEKMSANK